MSGHVRLAQPRDLDRVAALWTSITHHHEAIDSVFEMRPNADSEVKNLILGLFRDPSAQIFVYDDAGDLPGICIVRLDHSPPIMVETSRAEITDGGGRVKPLYWETPPSPPGSGTHSKFGYCEEQKTGRAFLFAR